MVHAQTPTWTSVGGASPGPRFGHAGIYDAVNRRMVIFGGRDFSVGDRNDAWALNLALATPTWSQLFPSGTAPAVRRFMCAAYDPDQQRMLIFGGLNNSTQFDDTWELTLGASPAWNQLSPANKPASRYHAGSCYDTSASRMLVFGGWDSATRLGDAWAYTGGNWTQLGASTPLGVRGNPNMFHVDGTGKSIVSGGSNNSQYLGDTWELDGTSWAQLSPSPAFPSLVTCAFAGLGSGRALVIGGGNGSGTYYETVYRFTLDPSYAAVTVSGSYGGRGNFAAAYDPPSQRLAIYGGYNGLSPLGDTWLLGALAVPVTLSAFGIE